MSKENKSNLSGQRKYNIVYFIDGLGMGGAERLMVPILRNLSREYFAPRVCVFQVRDGNPVAKDLRALEIPVDLLPIPFLRDVTALPRLFKYLKDVKADLVHTQLELADNLGNIAAKLLHLPSVSTIHTMPSQKMKIKSKLHQNLELFSLRYFCDLTISVSEEARQFHLGISKAAPNTVRTIYNGIDLRNFADLDHERERASVRKEFGVPGNVKLLTTVAVLRELKGIQFMLRALPAILSAHPSTYYLIVGDGSYREALETEADKAGVKDRVIFAGQRSDIPRLLAASDLFILPTLTEALPTVLAEAMAARLPIIASAVGGVPEMVVDGQNGCLVHPSDPQELSDVCIALLSDFEKQKAMGAAGWQIVNDKFNIQEQIKQLTILYKDLINNYER